MVSGPGRLLAMCAVLLAASPLGFPADEARAQPIAPAVTSRSLSGGEAGTILGRGVVDSAGEDVGPLVDVLVDKAGTPVAGVIDVGGFLGVGSRRVAVAWRLLRFVPDNGELQIHLDLTFESAAAAPEFQGPDNTMIVIDRASP
jgi:hypothetical protein